ncbi:MAG: hypothetical protein ABFC77_07800 [Thermoguttaceae bacterium]
MLEHVEAALYVLGSQSLPVSDGKGRILPTAAHKLLVKEITGLVGCYFSAKDMPPDAVRTAFDTLASALRFEADAWLTLARTPDVAKWPLVNVPSELKYDPALFGKLQAALTNLRNVLPAKPNGAPISNVSERLPQSDAEVELLKPAIADLLRTIPETWATFDADTLTAIQENALFLLTGAGMVERRGWYRSTMITHPTYFEVHFQATGEGGFAKAVEKVTALEYETWGDVWQTWKTGEAGHVSPFHTEMLKPQEWRLTNDGMMARRDLDGTGPDEVFDFVFKRGFYGPGYWWRLRHIGSPKFDAAIIEEQVRNTGQNWQDLPRPPGSGSGHLVEFRKIEKPAGSQPVNLTNWGEGGDAFAAAFGKMLGPMFEAMSKNQQANTSPSVTSPLDMSEVSRRKANDGLAPAEGIRKRWVWDLYPLAKDSWGAWKLEDDEHRPDHRVYMRRLKGKGYLYPPHSMAKSPIMMSEGRVTPDDIAVHEGYVPTAADVALLKLLYPIADPYRPAWYNIKAALVVAGYDADHLDKSEAPVLLAMLRKINESAMAGTVDQANNSPPAVDGKAGSDAPTAKNEQGEGNGGAGSAPAKSEDGKPAKQKRGRPADTDPKRDKQIYEAWKTRQHKTQANCDSALGLPVGTTHAACERHRKRLERRDKNRRTK